jgi:hypothetical protein
MINRGCKFFGAMLGVLLFLQGCANTTTTGNPLPINNAAENLHPGEDAAMEGFFIVPGIDFSRYKKLIIADLNMDQVAVAGHAQTLAFTEDNKRFYRELYTAAVVDHLIADGAYRTVLDAEDGVFFLTAAIVRVAPPTAEDGAKPVSAMEAYLQSTSRITLTLELYDAQNRQLLASLTDTRDLGRNWGDNNQRAQLVQLRRAFDYWLAYLRKELDVLSAS